MSDMIRTLQDCPIDSRSLCTVTLSGQPWRKDAWPVEDFNRLRQEFNNTCLELHVTMQIAIARGATVSDIVEEFARRMGQPPGFLEHHLIKVESDDGQIDDLEDRAKPHAVYKLSHGGKYTCGRVPKFAHEPVQPLQSQLITPPTNKYLILHELRPCTPRAFKRLRRLIPASMSKSHTNRSFVWLYMKAASVLARLRVELSVDIIIGGPSVAEIKQSYVKQLIACLNEHGDWESFDSDLAGIPWKKTLDKFKFELLLFVAFCFTRLPFMTDGDSDAIDEDIWRRWAQTLKVYYMKEGKWKLATDSQRLPRTTPEGTVLKIAMGAFDYDSDDSVLSDDSDDNSDDDSGDVHSGLDEKITAFRAEAKADSACPREALKQSDTTLAKKRRLG